MNKAIAVALISGLVSIVAAGVTIFNSQNTDKNAAAIATLQHSFQEQYDKEKHFEQVDKYSIPLARAAFSLQSRLRNVLKHRFFDIYLLNGNDSEKKYAVENTTFQISEYFCWAELANNKILFIDLESDETTKQLQNLLDSIGITWGSDRFDYVDPHDPVTLRIFAGDQQAIGEALITDDGCMGYDKFALQRGRGANPFIDSLRDNVEKIGKDPAQAVPRLTSIQNKLIRVLDMIDPKGFRFTKEDNRREKVQ